LRELPFLPLFYRDVLNAWEEIAMHTPTTKKERENVIILSQLAENPFFYRQWFKQYFKKVLVSGTQQRILLTLSFIRPVSCDYYTLRQGLNKIV